SDLACEYRCVVRRREARRPGPRIADAEQLQGIDEGVDLRAREALVEDDGEARGGVRSERCPMRAGGRAFTGRVQHRDDLRPLRPPGRELAAGTVLRGVAK